MAKIQKMMEEVSHCKLKNDFIKFSEDFNLPSAKFIPVRALNEDVIVGKEFPEFPTLPGCDMIRSLLTQKRKSCGILPINARLSSLAAAARSS